MGGRGSQSGTGGNNPRIAGLDVTKDGTTTRYYFDSKNGKHFYQRGMGNTPEPTPLNMSPQEFKKRVEQNGATTEIISHKERSAEEESYRKKRSRRPDYELGVGLEDNSAYRKTARRNRLMNRAMKKR